MALKEVPEENQATRERLRPCKQEREMPSLAIEVIRRFVRNTQPALVRFELLFVSTLALCEGKRKSLAITTFIIHICTENRLRLIKNLNCNSFFS